MILEKPVGGTIVKKRPNFRNTLAIIIGGGEGNRLWGLTAHLPKPAVPIGADNVLLDFPVSSVLNSGFGKVVFIAQHLPHIISKHIASYPDIIASGRGEYIEVLTPFHQRDEFLSDQHALRRVHDHLDLDGIEYVILLNADQIWTLDFQQIFEAMSAASAHAVMVYKKVQIAVAAGQLGVVRINGGGLVHSMEEKPLTPYPLEAEPDMCCANTAIYCLDISAYREMIAHILEQDPVPNLSNTGIQWLIEKKEVLGYDIDQNYIPESADLQRGVWHDAGTHDTYVEVQRLLASKGGRSFNLYNRRWPIYRAVSGDIFPGPVKQDSVVSEGSLLGSCVILSEGSSLKNSVLASGTRVNDGASLSNTFTLRNCVVGAGSVLRGVILGGNVNVPGNSVLGDGYFPPGTRAFEEVYETELKQGLRPAPCPVYTKSGLLVIPSGWQTWS